MSMILFYCRVAGTTAPPLPVLPPGITAIFWRPGFALAPAGVLPLPHRVVWSAFHHLRVFRNRDHAIVMLQRSGACVHRTLVFPPYFRFPFMNDTDLQFGDLWTDPRERGKGLGSLGLAIGLRHGWQPGRRFWYLTEENNEASRRLALRHGFSLIGQGERVARFGLRAFGQFEMTKLR